MRCGASYPTGGTSRPGVAAHRECYATASTVRLARLPSGWAVTFPLCGPHAELWDLEAGADRMIDVAFSEGGPVGGSS